MSVPFNDPLLAAAMNTAHAGLKSGQEIGEQTERARARPLLDALKHYAECSDGCTCGDGWSHDAAIEAIAAYMKGKA